MPFLSGANAIISLKSRKWTERSRGDGDKALEYGLQSFSTVLTNHHSKKPSLAGPLTLVLVLMPESRALSPAAVKTAWTSKAF